MSEIVDNLLHPEAIVLKALLTREGRRQYGKMIVDDEENILQAQASGLILETVYFAGEEPLGEGFLKAIEKVELREIAWRTSKKIFENDKTSRVLAIVQIPKTATLGELFETGKDIVLLEELSIAGNIGAIIRTSLAFGAGGMILAGEDYDLTDRRIIRSSRGYVFSLPVVCTPLVEVIEHLKKSSYALAIASPRGGIDVDDFAHFTNSLVLALGSEKGGTSKELESAAKIKVNIGMDSRVESLNVSVSAGILLHARASRDKLKS